MERQELQDYLEVVFNLESQVYTYEQVAKKYNEKINSLKIVEMHEILYGVCTTDNHLLTTKQYTHIPKIYERGSYKEKWDWTKKPEYNSLMRECKMLNLIYNIKMILPILISILTLQFLNDGWIALSLIVGIAISGVLWINKPRDSGMVIDKKIKTYFENCYREELENKSNNRHPQIQRLNKELKEKVLEPKAKVKELLQKVYSKNIIFPKYRNFIAVAQMYEYFLSNRVNELEGPFGAYNLFEDELRHNIIINKLDKIIDKLDELMDIMGSICYAINDTNKLLSNINNTLGRIESNTALTAYNTQCIAYNTKIANQYYY